VACEGQGLGPLNKGETKSNFSKVIWGGKIFSISETIYCARYIWKICRTPRHVETESALDHTLILSRDIYAEIHVKNVGRWA